MASAILSAYALYVLADQFSIQPFLGLVAVAPLMALVGWGLQRFILERSARGGLLVPVLSTFGLSIILDNLLFQGFGADTRSLAPYVGDLSYDSWSITDDIAIGKLAALTMAVAVALLGGIQIVSKPDPGRPRNPRDCRGSRHRGTCGGQPAAGQCDRRGNRHGDSRGRGGHFSACGRRSILTPARCSSYLLSRPG